MKLEQAVVPNPCLEEEEDQVPCPQIEVMVKTASLNCVNSTECYNNKSH